MIKKEKTTRIHEIFTNSFASKKLYPPKMSKKKTGAKRKTKKATETQKSGVNLRNLVVAKFYKDEKAQAIALGFVIIMGILLTATIFLISTELPKQTKILEAEHAAKVPQDFAELGSAIDDVALSGDETASATCAIGLTSKSIPFVGVHASGGTLRFDTSRERFECLACSPGEPTVTGSGYWNSAPADFGYYDKYHVDTFPDEGAKLQLGAREDKIYDSGKNESISGEFRFNNFTVTNGTTLTTHLLTIHARNITIGPNSSINADAGGLAGGKYTIHGPLVVHGKGKGHGKGTTCNSTGGGGAGHNGTGGNGGRAWDCFKGWFDGGEGGSPYGSATNMSADFGSGGAGGACSRYILDVGYYEGGYGGNGGGVIFLDAPVINITGNVSANGGDGLYSGDGDMAWDSAGGGGGGGSGGTILLNSGNITIYGCLSVKGGNGAGGARSCDHYNTTNPPDILENNGGGGGGGSGGRLKIFNATALNFPTSHNLADHINVSGGAGGLGGVGKGDNCPAAAPVPTHGEDGFAGENGSIHIEKNYTESVPHYPAGYLISNVTDKEGHIGHDNTKNTPMVRYGIITWTETRQSGTYIYVKVRTSTNADMIGAMSWENCPPVTNGTDLSDLASVSDGHRYIQWRADLSTIETSRTPILHSINISYEYGLPVVADCKGSIEFSSHYFNLPNYKLVYEHGATIKNQTVGGELMLHPPPITISKSGATTALKISAVNLTGDGDTASGVFSSAVKVSYERADLLKGGLPYHNLTLNITTAYPTAWSRWFNKTCEDAGLVYGTAPGNYNLTGKGNPLRIMFYGNDTNPVNLWLKESEVAVEIEG